MFFIWGGGGGGGGGGEAVFSILRSGEGGGRMQGGLEGRRLRPDGSVFFTGGYERECCVCVSLFDQFLHVPGWGFPIWPDRGLTWSVPNGGRLNLGPRFEVVGARLWYGILFTL